MRIEGTGIEETKAELARLDEVMNDFGLIRAGQWDYERVTYDRKYEIKGEIFYLRVQGYAVDGDIGKDEALIQLMTPLLGKHYYPHGVEYGETEHFPEAVTHSSAEVLKQLKNQLDQLQEV
ncbi:hypothetical protein GJU40_05875 [Bacillus lacus]|uniref:YugN-like family protein n=1 Tax=Metabacillus lacus TaxID=1983721 RepID=A0A7X2IXM5_9BACI|nr:YugN family protein [Metabacillus lacus]MRX71702.1 hypothetical protein [Metabacillus lacus]